METLSDRSRIDHDRFTPSRVGLRRRGSGSGSKNSTDTQQQRRATRARTGLDPAATLKAAAAALKFKGNEPA